MNRTYEELASQFPLDRIEDNATLDRAIAFLDPLLPPFEDEGVRAYVQSLGGLIEEYESATIPLGEVTAGELLAVLTDGRGIGPVELARGTGVSEADVAAILGGVRPPTHEEAVAFGKIFSVHASTFLP